MSTPKIDAGTLLALSFCYGVKLCSFCDSKSNLRAWQSQNTDGPSSRAVCCSYGESAWWWEAEELVRKLLLTAVAVLLDAGSPLQACGLIMCLLVCRGLWF